MAQLLEHRTSNHEVQFRQRLELSNEYLIYRFASFNPCTFYINYEGYMQMRCMDFNCKICVTVVEFSGTTLL